PLEPRRHVVGRLGAAAMLAHQGRVVAAQAEPSPDLDALVTGVDAGDEPRLDRKSLGLSPDHEGGYSSWTPARRNVALQSFDRTAMSPGRMGTRAIQLGDKVINLQVPGIFTVIDRNGELLVIETARGLRMTVLAQQVRRLDDV